MILQFEQEGRHQPSFMSYIYVIMYHVSDIELYTSIYTIYTIYQTNYDGICISGMLSMEVTVLITASVKSVSSAIIEYGSMLLLGDFLSQ